MLQKYRNSNLRNNLAGSVGISLVILSMGLSIAIARTDNLSFGEGQKLLILSKEASELEAQASKLIELSNSLANGRRINEKDKIEFLDTRAKIVDSKGEIIELIEQD